MSLTSAVGAVPVLLLNLLMTSSSVAGQARHNEVKGWQGAEWGMTVEQVATAIGRPLGEPVKEGFDGVRRTVGTLGLSPDPQVTCHDVQGMAVGDSTATARFCFGGEGQTGLVLVGLSFKPKTASAPVKDSLTATYGKPRFGSVNFRDIKMELFSWSLPATGVYLRDDIGEGLLTLTFAKQRPAP